MPRQSPSVVRVLKSALLGAVVVGMGVAVTATASAQPSALVVGTAGPQCPAPTQPTLAAAVAAAAPGAVVTVCPGVYTGTTVIDKPLTLRGARAGIDARTGRADLARESVLDGGGDAAIRITGSTSGVTVDGFTIRNSGTATQPHDGIEAFSGGSGFTVVDNVITQTTYGINLSSSGAAPSTIARNRFDTNNRTGDQGGSGVFVCCGPGNALSVVDNAFTGHSSAAVNTAGDAARPSTGLRIERNTSVDDATFAVVVNANRASVSDNVVVRTPRATVAAGSALFVGGGTTGVTLARNTVTGGNATGIRVTNLFGPVNVDLMVSGNRVADRATGIRLSGQRSGSVTGNTVAASTGVGILLDADNAGVTVTGNRVAASAATDCRDDSSGTGTAGTADTWRANVGLRSLPVGLCGLR